MPTRPKKGSTPNQNTTGRAKGGGQKAVTGSTRSPEVAEEAGEARRTPADTDRTRKVVVNHEEQASPGNR